MKIIYTLLTILSLSFLFSACDSETEIEDLMYDTNTYTATYEIYMNGKLIQKGTTEEAGMMQTIPTQWANIITVGNDSIISVMIAGIPRTVGDVVTITDDDEDDDNNSVVTIDGWNLLTSDDRDEYYFSQTGSITRTSSTKITFEGTCFELRNPDNSVSFSGYVESEAYKNIK